MTLWPKTVRRQMALVLAVLMTAPLVVLGLVLIRTSQSAVQTTVSRDQTQLAVRTASELSQFIRRPRDLLKTAAALLGTLHADAWRQETVLVELALGDEMFGRVSSIGPDGEEIASSEPGTAARHYAQDPAFRAALRGENHLSAVWLSEDHMPFVTMSVPVRELGKTAGVLRADVNLRDFWRIVDQVRVGRTGRAYVVSEKGVLIAHEDKKRVLANEDRSAGPAASRALAGDTGCIETGPHGRRYVKAFAPIPSLGWAVIVEQAADEAYAFVRWMKIESWAFIGASLALALALSLLMAPALTRPIRQLSDSMRRVAQGDLEQALPTSRRDEIGDLMRGFNRMAARLKAARESERLAVIGKAAAAIAHELKNSLVMVSALIGLLPKRHGDPHFLEKFSAVLPRELGQWKDMLEDISDYTRKAGFGLSAVDVKALLSDFEFVVRERLAQNKIGLEIDCPEDLPPMKGNRQKLKQALINLTLNAIDAMPGGGFVRVSAAAEGSSLVLRVSDTGKGIPAERSKEIFEPFHTTKANHLGLGLSIVREIVEYQGGRIGVENRAGEGASFVLRFPVSSAQAVPASP